MKKHRHRIADVPKTVNANCGFKQPTELEGELVERHALCGEIPKENHGSTFHRYGAYGQVGGQPLVLAFMRSLAPRRSPVQGSCAVCRARNVSSTRSHGKAFPLPPRRT